MPNPDENPASPIILAESLDLTAAAPLAGALLAVRGAPVSLNASGVTRLGAQCLQVLLASRQTWSNDGQPWAVVDPSPEFADAAALLGCPDLACANPVQD